MSHTRWICLSCGAEVDEPGREPPRRWCPVCLATHLWVRPARRPVGDTLQAAARTWTAADVVRQSWSVRTCPATGLPWAPPALALLVGPAGSGKSTLAAQIAAQCSPVTIVSAEEAPGPALARRLVLADMAQRRDVVVTRSLDAAALARRAQEGGAVLVDSVTATALQPSDLRALADAGADLVLAVTQVTKAGQAAGSNALVHEADLVLDLAPGGQWTAAKSRYGPTGATGTVRGVAPDDPAPAPTPDTPTPEVTA